MPSRTAPPLSASVQTTVALDACASQADCDAERFSTAFVLGAFDDLVLRARISGPVPLGQTLAIEMHGPSGGLVTVYRRPIDSAQLQFVIPIEGTDISRYHLAGPYGVVAAVEPDGPQIGAMTIRFEEAP